MATVEAKVYRGTPEGNVIETKEHFTTGDEEILLKVWTQSRVELD
jgi:hypothetical protein